MLTPLLFGALVLCSCSGGGGGGAAGSSSADESDSTAPLGFLPDRKHFIPAHVAEARLEIKGSSSTLASYELQLSCTRDYPTGECASGTLDGASTSYMRLFYADPAREDGKHDISGRWEQWGTNGFNCIVALRMYQNNKGERELITGLDINILSRADDAYTTDATIILHGRVSSGTLITEDGERHSLTGGSVILTYTIAPGYVNDTTHNTPSITAEFF